MSKYGVFSGPYCPVFRLSAGISPNTGKYGLEKTPYLDSFHAVIMECNFWVTLLYNFIVMYADYVQRINKEIH